MANTQAPYAGASKASIQRHYDVGNEFWSLWLDPMMVYSGAMWAGEDDTLAQAQMRKLDYFIEGTGAPGSDLVLDVGCGWGGALRRLVDVHGVKRVVGLTLSEAQREWVEGIQHPQISVRVENWADHLADDSYDAIISLGAFEHFADIDQSREEKVEAYRRFFNFCRQVLVPGGRLGLQAIAKGRANMTREGIEDARFIWENVFNQTDVPWISDVIRASERTFELTSVRNDPTDYVRTAGAWAAALERNRELALAAANEETYEVFARFLEALGRSFETGHVGLTRYFFTRR
jgi:cyclopropane-fatty-acyl-phospholipid synthase